MKKAFLYTSCRSVCGVRLIQGGRVPLVLTVLREETETGVKEWRRGSMHP